MSIGLRTARKRIDMELRLAWAGLGLALVALALHSSLERHVAFYGAIQPAELKEWGIAIAAFASSLAAASSSAIIFGKGLVRFVEWLFDPDRKRRKSRRKRKAKPDGEGKPEPAPADP